MCIFKVKTQWCYWKINHTTSSWPFVFPCLIYLCHIYDLRSPGLLYFYSSTNWTLIRDTSTQWSPLCQNSLVWLESCVIEIRINYILLFPPAVSCGMPRAPANGGVLAPDYSAGTRATYFCNEGFRLSSKEVTSTVCQADGTWSSHNKIPRCTGETRRSRTSPHVHGFISTDGIRGLSSN